MRRCSAHRLDGTPCRGQARPGRDYCFAHDPVLQDRRAAARLTGGRNKRTAHRLDALTPASVRPLLTKLYQALDGVESGTLTPQQGSAISSLAGAILKAFETAELEGRLRALEKNDAHHVG